jgi:hypothetical protein
MGHETGQEKSTSNVERLPQSGPPCRALLTCALSTSILDRDALAQDPLSDIYSSLKEQKGKDDA